LVTLQDLFVFDKQGLTEKLKVRGCFRATGIRPKFYERLAACGLVLPAAIFESSQEVG
jgi:pilus assembly protein CpaF